MLRAPRRGRAAGAAGAARTLLAAFAVVTAIAGPVRDAGAETFAPARPAPVTRPVVSGDTARVARPSGFGRLTRIACGAGARAARAGWVAAGAGAVVCVAGLWYDLRARWAGAAGE